VVVGEQVDLWNSSGVLGKIHRLQGVYVRWGSEADVATVVAVTGVLH
jgi:hypothetical protein